MLTTRSAAHLVQITAGAGEADDDSDNGEHKDGQSDGHSRSKPAKKPVKAQGLSPLPRTSIPHHTHAQGAPLLPEETLGNTDRATSGVCSLNLFQPQVFPQV